MPELQTYRYSRSDWERDILTYEHIQPAERRFLENNDWAQLHFATTYPKDCEFRRECFVAAMTWLQEHAQDVNKIYGINDAVMRLNAGAKRALYLAFVAAKEYGLPEVSDSEVLSAIRKLQNQQEPPPNG